MKWNFDENDMGTLLVKIIRVGVERFGQFENTFKIRPGRKNRWRIRFCDRGSSLHYKKGGCKLQNVLVSFLLDSKLVVRVLLVDDLNCY